MEFGECLANGSDEFVHLFKGVARRDSNPETFFANGNSGIVDGLDVNVVFRKKLVRCRFCKSGISN
jgi:hypothetical protein